METSIPRIIEIPLHELQTEKAKSMDCTLDNLCLICGKKIKGKSKMVHLLHNGNIVSYEGDDIEGSQGWFQVGSDCAKKLVIKFAF